MPSQSLATESRFIWYLAFLVLLGIALLLVLVAMARVLHSQRMRRVSKGCCGNCGYDLQANTSGVCPECGFAPDRSAKITPHSPIKNFIAGLTTCGAILFGVLTIASFAFPFEFVNFTILADANAMAEGENGRLTFSYATEISPGDETNQAIGELLVWRIPYLGVELSEAYFIVGNTQTMYRDRTITMNPLVFFVLFGFYPSYALARRMLRGRAAVSAYCPQCGYDLTGFSGTQCPNCGAPHLSPPSGAPAP